MVISYGKTIREDRDYWLARLERLAERAKLVSDFDRPSEYACTEDAVAVVVPRETAERLAKLTNDSPLLIYAAILALFKICLFKYTGDSSVIVGSPPRWTAETRLSSNAVPIVTEIDESMTIRQVLLRVRETLIEAYARQQYPVTASAGLRSPAKSSLPTQTIGLPAVQSPPLAKICRDFALPFFQTGIDFQSDWSVNARSNPASKTNSGSAAALACL